MEELREQAEAVLRENNRGGWTRPSPSLYPHQWSWDAAFIALGWARLDPARAVDELRHLFRGQWSTGMVPHIVFDPSATGYEPGPETWETSAHSPAGVLTSGICQPPVHALALHRIWQRASDDDQAMVEAAVTELYPKLVAWHHWLRTARDPEGSGLVTILHPWESGMDNSPRWDAALAALTPTEPSEGPLALEPDRPDLRHVADPGERPTALDYDHYRALVDALIAVDYDQAAALQTHPFRVKDVFLSAILAAADDALAELAGVAGHAADADGHRSAADRTRAGLDRCWDEASGRCLDLDVVSGRPLVSDTVAAFAPLIGGSSIDRTGGLVERLWSSASAGHPDLRWPVPTTCAVDDAAFEARRYWRGPQWPPITWLLWWGLLRTGHRRSAEQLVETALEQLRTTGCSEYVDPLTGDALGSRSQSWTAAVILDWIA